METQEDVSLLQPQENVESLNKEKKRRPQILFFISCCILLMCFIGYAIVSNQRIISPEIPLVNATITPTIQTNTFKGGNAFIDMIPNFDTLQVSDLPNMTDVRDIYTFGNSYIIASLNKIIDVDMTTHQIKRVNNPDTLGCVYSTAKVDKYLYIACNVDGTFEGQNILTKVDLETGEMIKEYFINDSLRRTNLKVIALDTVVWGSSWDGVFALDTTTEKLSNFSLKEMGFYEGCVPEGIRIINDAVTISISHRINCFEGAMTYDKNTNSWIKIPDVENLEVNQKQIIDDLKLPNYVSVSNQVNNSYILVSTDGLYTLQRNEFPEKILSFPKSKLNGLNYYSYSSYVDPEKHFVVVIGVSRGPESPNTFASAVPILVINLTTKQVYYVTDTYVQSLNDSPLKLWSLLLNHKIIFVPMTNGVRLMNEDQEIATITFSPANVIFSEGE